MNKVSKKFDIHKRIFDFVIRVLRLIRFLPKTYENQIIVEQLIRSSTSMGANDREADGVSSIKDFVHCYTVVRKEANETLYWLELLEHLNLALKSRMQSLLQENKEIIKIVSKIIINTRSK